MSEEVLVKEPAPCNLCGLTCHLKGALDANPAGLHAKIYGSFDSTPGNGAGALDDGTFYKFSLCEFCLDWLFGQFTIPVEVTDYVSGVSEGWRPAIDRVYEDEWRKMKRQFVNEWHVRGHARRSLVHREELCLPGSCCKANEK